MLNTSFVDFIVADIKGQNFNPYPTLHAISVAFKSYCNVVQILPPFCKIVCSPVTTVPEGNKWNDFSDGGVNSVKVLQFDWFFY